MVQYFLDSIGIICNDSAMQLNIEKIDQELKRRGWNRNRYAKALGISRSLLSYYMCHDIKKLIVAEKLAKPLNLNPKDLII